MPLFPKWFLCITNKKASHLVIASVPAGIYGGSFLSEGKLTVPRMWFTFRRIALLRRLLEEIASSRLAPCHSFSSFSFLLRIDMAIDTKRSRLLRDASVTRFLLVLSDSVQVFCLRLLLFPPRF